MRWSSRDDFVLGRCGPLDEYSLSKDAPACTCTSGEVYVNDMLPRYGVLAGRLDELVIERVCCFHDTRKALMPARVAGYELAKRGYEFLPLFGLDSGAEILQLVGDHEIFPAVYPFQGAQCVWVPNWSSTSCDVGVFVDQSAESIAASDVKRGRRRRGWKRLQAARRGSVFGKAGGC
jgi:hypothetical protein